MATLIPGRVTAAHEGDIVVFHIGMRFNNFRAVRSWWPVFTAMPRMLAELEKHPAAGMLGYRTQLSPPRGLEIVQYWESREKLLAFAAATDRTHRPAWAAFNRAVHQGHGKVGIYHETFLVPAGNFETIYYEMPAHGLAAATGHLPVGRRGESAAERLDRREEQRAS
ncbi:hypothetical protein CFP65_7621 [Kitasatospora sp. MMS16-BH015]|uniref:DUF4188 domain-containing protein n=1 Tax=Kitasatospora sp. MMS16-BH015 TaxID=2018025 RepID=UPI000CA184DD|nr:DUF4188 domain-containing protein [Kitasatospora sp. MMS16-BH015]AUG82192.1 hypothetical protein CFP65_7621 [Kitasatospora sp. MMS16-BH015]